MERKPAEGHGKNAGPVLVLTNEMEATIEVPLENCGLGPGLGVVNVSVVDSVGKEIVPSHRYHFDVRTPRTLNLNNYVEEASELPNLPAFLQVEPYQQPGNRLPVLTLASPTKLADDLPRECPKCGGPLHLCEHESACIYYPILPDGTVAAVCDPDLTWRKDEDGERVLICLNKGCDWKSDSSVEFIKGGPQNAEEA